MRVTIGEVTGGAGTERMSARCLADVIVERTLRLELESVEPDGSVSA
jgi:hypothetical protein